MINIKKIISPFTKTSFLFLTFSTPINAMPTDPVLIDYNLSGTGQMPYFEPRKLDLLVGQSYLLVINNPFPDAINVVFGDMGKAIHTHYLQGVPGMSQSSMMVPADGKVTWILDINKPGNYEIFAINMGMGQKGLPSHIIVQPEGGYAQYTAEELAEFAKLNQQLKLAQKTEESPVPHSEVDTHKEIKNPIKKRMGGRPD